MLLIVLEGLRLLLNDLGLQGDRTSNRLRWSQLVLGWHVVTVDIDHLRRRLPFFNQLVPVFAKDVRLLLYYFLGSPFVLDRELLGNSECACFFTTDGA